MILIAESPSRRTEYRRYLGNAGGSIITAFFYGIVFMIAYYRANSIVSPAIAHYMVNLVIYL